MQYLKTQNEEKVVLDRQDDFKMERTIKMMNYFEGFKLESYLCPSMSGQ